MSGNSKSRRKSKRSNLKAERKEAKLLQAEQDRKGATIEPTKEKLRNEK